MPKQCTKCEKPFISPLDEYGPPWNPLCFDCWMTDDDGKKDEDDAEKAKGQGSLL